MSLQALLTAVLLPPISLLLLALLGLLLMAARWRRFGAACVLLGILGVLALGTPRVEQALRGPLERAALQVPGCASPQTIVVLGGDGALSKQGIEIGPLTLERLRTGAQLQRRLGLPLLVTGGAFRVGESALGTLMQQSLERDFGVPVRWVEAMASDTRGNAENSAALLRDEKISCVWLVTHGWHMARSREAFARAGLETSPAPVRIEAEVAGGIGGWLPRPDRFAGSWYMLREWVGRLVYALRDG